MELIRHAIACPAPAVRIAIPVDRLTLAKTRWRGVAADGAEFGFDLHQPLQHGDCVHVAGDRAYCIEQAPEPVLEFPLGGTPQDAAKLGWLLGNLHQVVQVGGEFVRVADDPAVRQLADQQHLHVHTRQAVFTPFRSGAGHHHH
ncbi:MAG TPA: urease accessory protein UreE [Kiritimatiellia bacterium]|nr:urease accessory protein UreE [Kiritimatiellia bacterium]